MNPETSSTTSAPATQSCRVTQVVLLISLLMMGAGNGLFLWNSIRAKNEDVTRAQKFVAQFETNNAPRIKTFIADLQAYGRSNPDFSPVLAKYNLLGTPAAPAAAPKK